MSSALVNYVETIESDFLPTLKTCHAALDLDGLKRDDATRTAIEALGVVLGRMDAAHKEVVNMESEGVNFSGSQSY